MSIASPMIMINREPMRTLPSESNDASAHRHCSSSQHFISALEALRQFRLGVTGLRPAGCASATADPSSRRTGDGIAWRPGTGFLCRRPEI